MEDRPYTSDTLDVDVRAATEGRLCEVNVFRVRDLPEVAAAVLATADTATDGDARVMTPLRVAVMPKLPARVALTLQDIVDMANIRKLPQIVMPPETVNISAVMSLGRGLPLAVAAKSSALLKLARVVIPRVVMNVPYGAMMDVLEFLTEVHYPACAAGEASAWIPLPPGPIAISLPCELSNLPRFLHAAFPEHTLLPADANLVVDFGLVPHTNFFRVQAAQDRTSPGSVYVFRMTNTPLFREVADHSVPTCAAGPGSLVVHEAPSTEAILAMYEGLGCPSAVMMVNGNYLAPGPISPDALSGMDAAFATAMVSAYPAEKFSLEVAWTTGDQGVHWDPETFVPTAVVASHLNTKAPTRLPKLLRHPWATTSPKRNAAALLVAITRK